MTEDFKYEDCRFADIQMLRYRLDGFDKLTLRQKKLVYCLAEAALWGRDMTFDQFGRYNLKIRKTLEAIYTGYDGDRNSSDFKGLETYLKRVWFSNGIYHHYGCDKFEPGFSKDFFVSAVKRIDHKQLPLQDGQGVEVLLDELLPVIFDAAVLPVKVCKKIGWDLVKSSACNFYEGVSQDEVEDYYSSMKKDASTSPHSYGLNTTVIKENGKISELTWRAGGKYSAAIEKIITWLGKALAFAENDQ